MPLRSMCRCSPAWSWLLAAERPACGSRMSPGGLPTRPGPGQGTHQAAALRWAGLALSRAICGLMKQAVAGLPAREQAVQPMSMLRSIGVQAAPLPCVSYLSVCKQQPLLADSIAC